MSYNHNERVKNIAMALMTRSPFRCMDPDGMKRTEILFRFYKLNHTCGVLVQFTIISAVKIALLVPLWGGIFGQPHENFWTEDADEIMYIAPTTVKSEKTYKGLEDDSIFDSPTKVDKDYVPPAFRDEQANAPHAGLLEGEGYRPSEEDLEVYSSKETKEQYTSTLYNNTVPPEMEPFPEYD